MDARGVSERRVPQAQDEVDISKVVRRFNGKDGWENCSIIQWDGVFRQTSTRSDCPEGRNTFPLQWKWEKMPCPPSHPRSTIEHQGRSPMVKERGVNSTNWLWERPYRIIGLQDVKLRGRQSEDGRLEVSGGRRQRHEVGPGQVPIRSWSKIHIEVALSRRFGRLEILHVSFMIACALWIRARERAWLG